MADNIYRIFSLRDAHNAPHATVAVKGAFFREIKMKHNQAASGFALGAVRPLMEILLPISDPVRAASIVQAEGFGPDSEAMLLGMISKPARRPAP